LTLFPKQDLVNALKARLHGRFGDHFEEVPPESIAPTSRDATDQLELLHYLYLYKSEQGTRTRCQTHVGKEPFMIYWINHPAQYLRSILSGDEIS
jgi:hypothetical protein